MPLEGSEQQRLKTALDITEERLSIEREINKIIRDRTDVIEDSYGVDKKLTDLLTRRAGAIARLGEKRETMERELLRLTIKAETEKDDTIRASFQAQIVTMEKMIGKEEQRTRIAKMLYDSTKEQISVQKLLVEEEKKRFEKSMSYLGHLGDIFKMQQKHYMNLQNSTKLQGKQLMLAASLMATFEMMFETFKQIDDSLAKFRITMGMMRKDVERISSDIREVATQFANVGVTVEGAATATMALANEFGGTMKISKDLVETTSLLKAQLGVAEESSAGFLRNMGALTKTTAQSQRYMAYVADQMTAAAGIPLNLVMQDVAKMSGNALALVSKMPLAIVKSAVEARKLGTNINKMADASAQILNFTESVQQEMEASVLLGQAINLQRARYLAYQGRIVESTKEILAIAKRIDFEHLDFFQMQAFAAATGRSADELLRMVQAERQLREARNIEGLRDEVALYDDLQRRQEAALKNDVLQRELAVQRMANQARMTALQQQWNQLWMETMRVMYPVFNIGLGLATVLVRIGPQIATIVGLLKSFKDIGSAIEAGGIALAVWSSKLTKIGSFIVKIGDGFKFFGNVFSKILGYIGKFTGLVGLIGKLSFLTPFLKAVPVIGWIITGIQFVHNLFKRFKEYVGKDGLIIGGLKAIGMALYDTLLAPFVGVWNWVKKIFVGESPSQLGLGIVRGIIGVQAKIFDALTSPFRRFLAWIVDKIPGMGGLAEKIRGGMSGALTDVGVLEKQKQLTAKGAVTETTPVATPAPVIPVQTPEQQRQKETDSTTLSEILKSLQILNANLMSGKIGVYIDGQLMSATLARQTAFKGGYGVNTV